jgi:hypothetical protein
MLEPLETLDLAMIMDFGASQGMGWTSVALLKKLRLMRKSVPSFLVPAQACSTLGI